MARVSYILSFMIHPMMRPRMVHPLVAGVCWDIINLEIFLMLLQMTQGLFSDWGNIEQIPRGKGILGSLVCAKLEGSRAKLAGLSRRWFLIWESNPEP